MPDIFVPMDTSFHAKYYNQVISRGLIQRFALRYTDQYRDRLNDFKDYHELVQYLDNQDLLKQFIAFAEKNGIKESHEEIILSQDVLMVTTKALIARFILDNEGYYPIIHTIDPNIQKSLEIFAQQ
jgi:carboxyl-terminal processing protease